MDNKVGYFVENVLNPAIYENAATIFPKFQFKKERCSENLGGERWVSHLHIDGTPSTKNNPKKSHITAKYPNKIFNIDGDLYNGKKCISLIDLFIIEQGGNVNSGEDYIEAIKTICTQLGLEMPEYDSKQYESYKERKKVLAKCAEMMEAELLERKTNEAKVVWDYLTVKRGFEPEFIKFAHFGVYTKRVDDLLFKYGFTGYSDQKTDELKQGNWYKYYLLSIPYINASEIQGFKFRLIQPDETRPKYVNNRGLKKNNFGLSGLKLTGDKLRDKFLTVVEGELDCLYARYKGIKNIIAVGGISGNSLNDEALTQIKSKGVEAITLLFDSEETLEKQINTENKLESTVTHIEQFGLMVYVAYLQGFSGEKCDVVDYLQSGHTVIELNEIIENAKSKNIYRFQKLTQKYDIKEQGITINATIDLFTEEVKEILKREDITETEKAIINEQYNTATGQQFPNAALNLANKEKREQEAQKRAIETQQVIQQVNNLFATGQPDKAAELMAVEGARIASGAKANNYDGLLSVPTAEQFREKLKYIPVGIETKYQFGKWKKSQNDETGCYIENHRFLIPSGAITYICALPSHGKSRFLQNLALDVAKGCIDTGETVLFFSYEESAEAVSMQFLNKYIDEDIAKYNGLSIENYYKNKDVFYVEKKAVFEAKEKEFIKRLISSGTLKIFYENYDSTALIEAITYLHSKIKIKAVFIDYVQLLNKKGCKLQRNEELKEISIDFKNMAVSLRLPVVMAAQLNREVKNPNDFHNQKIAESADLERNANVVMCIWDNAFRPINNKSGNAFNDSDLIEYNEKGINLDGSGGKLFVKITKHRGGIPNIETILEYNGNTGIIKSNIAPQQEQRTEKIISDNQLGF